MRSSTLFATLLVAYASAGAAAPGAARTRPGAVPEILAPGVISGPASVDSAAFTPDGDTLVFDLSNWPAHDHAIMISQRVNGAWSTPRLAPFSGQWEDHDPAMAPDGSYLIYSSNRPATADGKPLATVSSRTGKLVPSGDMHLWRVDRDAHGWGTPTPLPDVVNISMQMYGASIAADGTLYFDSPGPRRGGATHLYRATCRDGHYLAPTRLSLGDATSHEYDTAIAPDQSFIVYDVADGGGASPRLHIAFREGDHWSQPVDMGDALNRYQPSSAHLGPDGRTLYFAGRHADPVRYPRARAQALRDVARTLAWDHDVDHLWRVSLAPWLDAHRASGGGLP